LSPVPQNTESFALESVSSGDSLDWKDLPAGEITKRVTSKVQSGSIVLFHNAAKHTPEALPGILEQLLQAGFTFVPISQIILPQPYTIDHTGRQCPAPKSAESPDNPVSDTEVSAKYKTIPHI